MTLSMNEEKFTLSQTFDDKFSKFKIASVNDLQRITIIYFFAHALKSHLFALIHVFLANPYFSPRTYFRQPFTSKRLKTGHFNNFI
jgi:hypothetical protein